MARALIRAFVAVVLLWGLQTARAQPTHHQPLTSGSRSLGMAGAYTAIAEDNSAIFQNPAGLPTPVRASVSGGVNFFSFGRLKIDDALQTADGNANILSEPRLAVPSYTAATIRFGRRDEEGVRAHALALSLFTPQSYRFDGQALVVGAGANQVRIREDYRSEWIGLSYAHRPHRRVQFGATLFFSRSRLEHDDSRQSTVLALSESSVGSFKLRAFHLVARFGLLVRASRRLRLGLMFQPPGIRLASSVDLRALRLRGADERVVLERDGVAARQPIPWELRLGAAVQVSAVTTLAADVAFVGPIGDASFFRDEPELDGQLVELLPFFSTSPERTWSLNGSLGVHFRHSETVQTRFGFLTDVSTAPDIEGQPTRAATPQIHRFGASASIALRLSPAEFSLAFMALLGRGEAVAVAPDSAQPFRRTDASSRTFLLQITGVAETVENTVREVRRRRGHEEEEEEASQRDE